MKFAGILLLWMSTLSCEQTENVFSLLDKENIDLNNISPVECDVYQDNTNNKIYLIREGHVFEIQVLKCNTCNDIQFRR